ncbi:MAG: trigger factor [Gemmatimonadetes bacterium]|uniref:Trigger factor n=1 Tax=Candidatus Kutchimonas denitrificans TaxID=3056748 RepID=A0AAE5C9S2_9BACT|nr:trigger factor [Gemmatimonadota bacterium]NIR73742.1 trigger factor [Candidatus Kutchimonas denitrificans]NIS03106.1 trigger factor [Gemmatimonadota bacterium]NIT69007.1 trigger factor [Gemmatimonadota bacterium]NIU54098.1 trigger factor [Gemmatimonadota bacterium]
MSQVTRDLQISVEEPAAWGRKLVITVPPGRVKSERARIAKRLAKKVRLPGFRKGKVPPERIEARYGAEIDRQTQQQIIDVAFREAIEEKDLEPISQPRVQNVVYSRDSEFTFEVTFDIRPEIKLSRLGGFRIDRPEVTVSEQEVEEQLEAVRQQQALWSPVERKPAAGDTVEVVITPISDETGEPGESQPYQFPLGQGHAIPDVESAITTLEPGSSGEFEVRFPDDFDDEARRGEKTRLRIELKRVLEQELPPLNDELAKSVGDFEDLDALRSAVAEDIRKHKEHEADQQVNRRLIEHVIEANPFQVPESMVDRYVDALLGTPPEGADPDQVAQARDEARPAALWGIKRTLVVQRLAEEQGFEASKEEVDERVKAIAERLGRPVGQVRANLAKSGELRDIERGIVEGKVFDFLREASEIKGAKS